MEKKNTNLETRYDQEKERVDALLRQIQTMKLETAQMDRNVHEPLQGKAARVKGEFSASDADAPTVGDGGDHHSDRIVALENVVSRLKFQNAQLMKKHRTARRDAAAARVDKTNFDFMDLSIIFISFVIVMLLFKKLKDWTVGRKGTKRNSSKV